MKQRFMATERREELKERKSEEGAPRKKLSEHRYDPDSFEGRVTFAPMHEDGPDYYDTLDLTFKSEEEFARFKLGKIYIISFEEDDTPQGAEA